MTQSVLITGGAGFIGTRLAKALVAKGYQVRVLDNLLAQVHGPGASLPIGLAEIADVWVNDIADSEKVKAALSGVDIVVHLAAETGPAQSMYEIERYMGTNVHGTATLLQEMLPLRGHIRKLVVASSRAIYGEGKYMCPKCGVVVPSGRPKERLARGLWESVCASCGSAIALQATTEDTLPAPTSIYAVGKLSQEQMGLVFGHAYDIPAVALRYQNVYGVGQSLRNPYIGILAIFCARLLEKLPIHLYEDGRMVRDFVHVDDAVSATLLAIESEPSVRGVYNVGSGHPQTILEVAQKLVQISGLSVQVTVTGEYRVGDIRHNYADLTQVNKVLGYQPRVSLETGLRELFEWARREPKIGNLLEHATEELANVGLFKRGT